jgi:cytochrome-b5 reductase
MTSSNSSSSRPLIALENSNAIYKFKLISKELINHDVARFVFELPSTEHTLGTRAGEHFFIIANLKGHDDGDAGEVWRKYTPVNLETQKGRFETLVKV